MSVLTLEMAAFPASQKIPIPVHSPITLKFNPPPSFIKPANGNPPLILPIIGSAVVGEKVNKYNDAPRTARLNTSRARIFTEAEDIP